MQKGPSSKLFRLISVPPPPSFFNMFQQYSAEVLLTFGLSVPICTEIWTGGGQEISAAPQICTNGHFSNMFGRALFRKCLQFLQNGVSVFCAYACREGKLNSAVLQLVWHKAVQAIDANAKVSTASNVQNPRILTGAYFGECLERLVEWSRYGQVCWL